MSTTPSGDAMTVRYHSEAAAALLKRREVPRPIAWRIHPADAAECAARGEHCQGRRCRNPIEICTWRWWRSAEAGRILLVEHFVCAGHGQEFAGRYHVIIEPHPGSPSTRRPGNGPR